MHDIEFECENKYYLDKLLEMCKELNIDAIPKWTSKYNSYVTYEYEPFCPDGYILSLKASCNNYGRIMFLKYIYEKFQESTEALNKALEIEREREGAEND